VTQVLARKWRPRTFAELVGQEHVVTALSNALTQQRLHHAYLFTGTRGVGKTTLARIIAKALNCEAGVTAQPCGSCGACTQIDAGRFVDLIELDAASNTQVDNMRDLLENALYAPTTARFKVYIIDEVHMLSRSAFNAMLKTLEEPPGHVKFILATTDPQKVPVTVLSRCLQFNLKQIPQAQIAAQLRRILGHENVPAEDAALALVARMARGSMRDALSLLDQAIAHGAGRVQEKAVMEMLGSVDQDYLHRLLHALRRRDGKGLIEIADRMAEASLSFETALQDLGSLFHRIALAQAVPAAIGGDDPERPALQEFSTAFSAEEVQLFYQIVLQGRQELGFAPDEYAGFTMALLRLLAFAPAAASLPDSAETGSRATPPRSAQVQPGQPDGGTTPLKKKLTEGNWPAVAASLALGGMEKMLADNCEFAGFDGRRLVLRVPPAQKHLLDRAYQDRLRQALHQQLGPSLQIEIGVGAENGNTPAGIRERENRKRHSEAAIAVDSDSFVRELVENFDARVVESTIKPVK
jgi:DNA polymerase III subunit gamma/tau